VPTCAVQQVGSCLRYSGRGITVVAEAAPDPEQKNAAAGARLQGPSNRHLHLREAAIREQFHSGDIAAVVGGEKYDSLRNLV
jgi:hypothetical protein